jgi:class 3 adenylate cyclase
MQIYLHARLPAEISPHLTSCHGAQVLTWMKRVRAAIEEMLLEHGMRLIETRGDNYLAITTAEDGPAPAARALRFAARASAAVADLRGTRLRVGLASGHVTVAALRCMGGREVLCLFGDAVNVAGRLEQVSAAAGRCLKSAHPRAHARGVCVHSRCGGSPPPAHRAAAAPPLRRQSADPDHVLVSEPVALAAAAARTGAWGGGGGAAAGGGAGPPVRAIAAKGKAGGIRCARFAWRAAAFVDHGWPPPPSPAPAPRRPVALGGDEPALPLTLDPAPSTPPRRLTPPFEDGGGGGGGGGGGESPVPEAPEGPASRQPPPLTLPVAWPAAAEGAAAGDAAPAGAGGGGGGGAERTLSVACGR